jgi:sulfate transport system permease protein
MIVRYGLRFVALAYLALLLIVPVGIIIAHTFSGGLGPVWGSLTTHDAVKALELTLKIAVIVVPLNTVFGITMAILMVRREFPGKALLSALIDLPFAVSPVIVGFTLILVYGQNGWFGSFFLHQGYQIIFSTPGMVLATMFASLPFVAREVIPVLREIGTEQEQAAATLGSRPSQTFRRITLPAIRWGIVYGVVLTQTLTLRVSQEYQNFDHIAAYTAALELAVIALVTLFLMNLFHPRKDR